MWIHSGCFYQWEVMNEVLQTATMVAILLFHLGIFHSPCKIHHEFLHDPIFTFHLFVLLGPLLFQVHQAHGRCCNCWLDPFKLLQGKETSCLGFGRVIACLASGWFHGVLFPLLPLWSIDSQNKSFPVGWP